MLDEKTQQYTGMMTRSLATSPVLDAEWATTRLAHLRRPQRPAVHIHHPHGCHCLHCSSDHAPLVHPLRHNEAGTEKGKGRRQKGKGKAVEVVSAQRLSYITNLNLLNRKVTSSSSLMMMKMRLKCEVVKGWNSVTIRSCTC